MLKERKMEGQSWGFRGVGVLCVGFLERDRASPLMGQGTEGLCANLPRPSLNSQVFGEGSEVSLRKDTFERTTSVS